MNVGGVVCGAVGLVGDDGVSIRVGFGTGWVSGGDRSRDGRGMIQCFGHCLFEDLWLV